MDESTLLQQAIAAARAGRKAEAWRLLAQVLHQNQRNELAWLWLSSVVDSEEQRVKCLENVLMISPNNTAARNGLAQLQARIGAAPATTRPATSPSTVRCPHCGTPNRTGSLFCKKCGQSLEQPKSSPTASPPVTPCPHCGATNRAGATFCSGCGQSLGDGSTRTTSVTSDTGSVQKDRTGLVKEGTISPIVCPKCGAENPAGAMNCHGCHVNLEWALQNPEYFVEKPTVKCPKCGAVNLEEATSCEVCGINLEWAREHIKEICPNCGAEIPPEATNCQTCGIKLEWAKRQIGRGQGTKAEKPWYRSSGFYALAFFLFTPAWALLMLSDEDQPGWVKATAGIVLIINVVVWLIILSD